MSVISTCDLKTGEIKVKHIKDGKKADISKLVNFYVNMLVEMTGPDQKD